MVSSMEPDDPRPTPARAIVLDARPLGADDGQGKPLFVVDVTLLAPGTPPARARVSLGAAAHEIRQLHPGSELAAVVDRGAGGPVVTLHFGDPAAVSTHPGVADTPDPSRSTS